MDREDILKSVTGTTTCALAGIQPVQPFHGLPFPLPVVTRPLGGNGSEPTQPGMSVVKRYELRAARSSRSKESLQW
jgi:hypothetical protein